MKMLGMRLFIASDLLTFAALLLVYGALRSASPEWPRPFSVFPGVVMTIVLLASSLTMLWAVKAMGKQDRGRALRWLLATMAGGAAFIAMHLSEWRHLIAIDKITPGSGIFGSVFFGITGLHMAHVAAGLVYLAVLSTGIARARFSAEDVETGGLYWHFVDLVWLFIFPLVYLTAVKP
jgi:cytochrome c oxidase subunit 3